jgi:hypothetical protein
MKAKPDIPELFQKSSHKLEEMPSPQTWNRLEQRLDRRKQQRGLFYRLGAAAAILVLVACSFLAGMYVNRAQPQPLASAEPFQLSPLPVNQSPEEALTQVRLSRRIYRNVSPSDFLDAEGEENLASLSDALKPSISPTEAVSNDLPGQLALAEEQAQKPVKEPQKALFMDTAEANTDTAGEVFLEEEAPLPDGVALSEPEEEQPEIETRSFKEEVAPNIITSEQIQAIPDKDISRVSAVSNGVEMKATKKKKNSTAFAGLEGSWVSSSINTVDQQNLQLSRKSTEKLTGKLIITNKEGKYKYKFTLTKKEGVETLEVSGKGTYSLKEKGNGNWLFENNNLSPSKIYFQKSGGQKQEFKENEWRLEKVGGRK